MSTRNEIKAVLRENTKKAFELMEVGIKASEKKEFTANELANMTGNRLSTKSVAGFLRSNQNNYSFKSKSIDILDTASYISDGDNVNIIISNYKIKHKKTTKTYVNVENENDVITVKREEMIYIFD